MESPEIDYDAVSEIHWAQLAAFIDSEGCIRIHCNSPSRKTGHRYHGIQVTIGQRDERLIDWLHEIFGGHRYKSKVVEGRTTMAYWRVNTLSAVEVIKRCLPFFVIKREQADVALEYRMLVGSTTKRVSPEVRLQQEALRLRLDALKHGHKIKVVLESQEMTT